MPASTADAVAVAPPLLLDARPLEASVSHAPRWPSSLFSHWVAGRPQQLAAHMSKEDREELLTKLALAGSAEESQAMGNWVVEDPLLPDAGEGGTAAPLELTNDAFRALLPDGSTHLQKRRKSRRTSNAFLVHAAALSYGGGGSEELPALEADGSLAVAAQAEQEEEGDDEEVALAEMTNDLVLRRLIELLKEVQGGDGKKGYLLEQFVAEAFKREFREHVVEEAKDLLALRDELLKVEDVKRRITLALDLIDKDAVTAGDGAEMGPLLEELEACGLGLELSDAVGRIQRYLRSLAGRHDDEERLTQAIYTRNAARISSILEQDLSAVDQGLVDEAYRVLKIVLREEAEEELAHAMETNAKPEELLELFQEAEDVGVDSSLMDEVRQQLQNLQQKEVLEELRQAVHSLDRQLMNRAYAKAKRLRITDPIVDEAHRLRYECSEDDITVLRLKKALSLFDHPVFDAEAEGAKKLAFKSENRMLLFSMGIQRAAQEIVVEPGKTSVHLLLSAISTARSRNLNNDVLSLARIIVSDSGPRDRSRSRAQSFALHSNLEELVDGQEEEPHEPRRGRLSVLVNASATFRTEEDAGDSIDALLLQAGAHGNVHDLHLCDMLRPQSDHAQGRKAWGKKHKSEVKYLSFTHKLYTSLVEGLDKGLIKMAVQKFGLLQVVMGDSRTRSVSKDDAVNCAMDLVETGCNVKKMRDELYAQTCKQLTENPNPVSRLRGYYTVCLYQRCFPPSPRFLPSLLGFFRGAKKYEEDLRGQGEHVNHVQTNELIHACGFVLSMLERGTLPETDVGPPTPELLRCLIFQEHHMVPVTFMSGETIDIPARLVSTANARTLLHEVEKTLDPDCVHARHMGGALDGYQFFLLDEGEVPSFQPTIAKAVDWDEDLVWASAEWADEGCVLLLRHMVGLRNEKVESVAGVLTEENIPDDWSRVEGLYVEERRNVQTDKYIGTPESTAYLAVLAIVIELDDGADMPMGQDLIDAAHEAEIFPAWMLEGEAGERAWNCMQAVAAHLYARLKVLDVVAGTDGVRHYLRAAFLTYVRMWPLFGAHTFPVYVESEGMGEDQEIFLAVCGDGIYGLHDETGVVQSIFHLALHEIQGIETWEEDCQIVLKTRDVSLTFSMDSLDDVHDTKATISRFCLHSIAKVDFVGGLAPDFISSVDQLPEFESTFPDLLSPPPPPTLPRAEDEWRIHLPAPLERAAHIDADKAEALLSSVAEEEEDDDEAAHDFLKYRNRSVSQAQGMKEEEEEEEEGGGDMVGSLPSFGGGKKKSRRNTRRSMMLQGAEAAMLRVKAEAENPSAADEGAEGEDSDEEGKRKAPVMFQRYPSAVFGVSRRKTDLKFRVPPPPLVGGTRFGVARSGPRPRVFDDDEEPAAPTPPTATSNVEVPDLVFRPLLQRPKMTAEEEALMQVQLQRLQRQQRATRRLPGFPSYGEEEDEDEEGDYYYEGEDGEGEYDDDDSEESYLDERYYDENGNYIGDDYQDRHGHHGYAPPGHFGADHHGYAPPGHFGAGPRRGSLLNDPHAMGVDGQRRGSLVVPAEQMAPRDPPPGAVRISDLDARAQAALPIALPRHVRPPSGPVPTSPLPPAPGPPAGTPPTGATRAARGVSFDARGRRPSLAVHRAAEAVAAPAFAAALEPQTTVGRHRAESIAQQRAATQAVGGAHGRQRRARLL